MLKAKIQQLWQRLCFVGSKIPLPRYLLAQKSLMWDICRFGVYDINICGVWHMFDRIILYVRSLCSLLGLKIIQKYHIVGCAWAVNNSGLVTYWIYCISNKYGYGLTIILVFSNLQKITTVKKSTQTKQYFDVTRGVKHNKDNTITQTSGDKILVKMIMEAEQAAYAATIRLSPRVEICMQCYP